MPTKAELQSLLERVEKATGPDREIDDLIFKVIPDYPNTSAPTYSMSVDEAIGLVERVLPGFQEIRLQFSLPLGIYCTAAIYKDTFTQEAGETFISPNKSVPLAILSAILHALIAQSDEVAA